MDQNPSLEIAVRESSNAAQALVDNYYGAINHRRKTIAGFYVQPTPSNPRPIDVSLNGNVVTTPSEVQEIFVSQIPAAFYEAQDFDVQVINLNYNIGTPESDLGPDSSGRKMSLLVIVSGYVKYGDQRTAEQRGFTENFVLVPNFTADTRRNRDTKRFLIQSQNFRLVL